MPELRQINQSGIDLIKEYEGFRADAYQDAVGVWTIGWGSTQNVRPGMRITQEQGESLLRKDLADAEAAVSRLVKVRLTSNEFSALVSFVFNLGQGSFGRSTLLRKLNAGDKRGAADEFRRWNKARVKGKLQVLRGLTRRREAEMTLFLRPDDE
jgi:GH24 family phage-related lysozyme (muramidase)